MNLYSQLIQAGELVLDGSRFPAIWLRDNCPCPQCTDPGSGQRLTDVLDIHNDVSVVSAAPLDDSVLVTGGGPRCYPDPDGLGSTLEVLRCSKN